LSEKKPSYEQIKNNDWLIRSVLDELEHIASSSGHGKIIITVQNAEVFEIEGSAKKRNPKYNKDTANNINTCKLGKI